jgi:hypothetical protein
VLILRLLNSHHCVELVGGNVVQGKGDAKPKGCHQIERAAQELASLRILRGVQLVERAFVTAISILG